MSFLVGSRMKNTPFTSTRKRPGGKESSGGDLERGFQTLAKGRASTWRAMIPRPAPLLWRVPATMRAGQENNKWPKTPVHIFKDGNVDDPRLILQGQKKTTVRPLFVGGRVGTDDKTGHLHLLLRRIRV